MLPPISQFNPLLENINVIRALEPGQSLDVNNAGNLKVLDLETKKSIDKLPSSLSRAYYAKVRREITTTLNALPTHLKDTKDIKQLIKKLAQLSREVFDRSAISQEIENLMCPALNPKRQNKIRMKKDLHAIESELLKMKKELAELYCKLDSKLAFPGIMVMVDEELLWIIKNSQAFQKSDKQLESLVQAYERCVLQRQRCRNDYEELRAEFKVESVRLANKLGMDFKPLNSGFSGSYVGIDRFGTRCLVFKPKDEEALTGNSPASTVRLLIALKEIAVSNLGVSDPNACLTAGQGYLAEAGASVVSRFLGLEIVPHTSVQKFKSKAFFYPKGQPFIKKEGSCQMFKNEAQTAKKALEMPDGVSKGIVFPFWRRIRKQFIRDQIPIHEFQKAVILMWINGELDGHEDNWLIKIRKDGTPKLVKIDSGMSFYKQHPDSLLQGIYQHAWKWLPQAKIPFGCYCKAIMSKLDAQDKMETLLAEIEKSMTVDGRCYFSYEQKRVMLERIVVLRHYVSKGKTAKAIVKIRTQNDFEKWFDKRKRKASSNAKLC